MNDGDMQSNEAWERAYIGLGSNIGDRERFLTEAVHLLQEHPQIRVTGQSALYETDPVGYTDQAPFLNMAIEVTTTLSPEQLLEQLMETERLLGRVRDIRWGPRTIDLDMLMYGNVRQQQPELTLPHPRMHERAFVLIPLIEVLELHHQPQAEPLRAFLERAEGKEGVTLWKKMQ
ncbi:2-amino-4-hydroxy-6-hydroxymethyldihydropteridinediphosphokinase [Paenibacillus tianmuensis]|uniref:2-amino-4-hydroxy-6-hydroxymethyldihydropteridine diphosphokinase n=1 Tax=Paenibacillus tianmuensis TaxID=624147 RepID=A0A1G4SUV7_9BACL|nr:2-amino-4-hydroxy-6-hydroxymethyldihydropteridine diphosphokinase [Paenibacillus tianmuensis]SCW72069.1 2-amino-4-hydroxy-6-hydroxymethyldihydropteridinediphosphokinase [Paenibacillus tianmuensis]